MRFETRLNTRVDNTCVENSLCGPHLFTAQEVSGGKQTTDTGLLVHIGDAESEHCAAPLAACAAPLGCMCHVRTSDRTRESGLTAASEASWGDSRGLVLTTVRPQVQHLRSFCTHLTQHTFTCLSKPALAK